MINTCSSLEFRDKVTKDGFGINIEAEDKNVLADAILNLYHKEEERQVMGTCARKIAEEQFDRPNSYHKIIELMETLM